MGDREADVVENSIQFACNETLAKAALSWVSKERRLPAERHSTEAPQASSTQWLAALRFPGQHRQAGRPNAEEIPRQQRSQVREGVLYAVDCMAIRHHSTPHRHGISSSRRFYAVDLPFATSLSWLLDRRKGYQETAETSSCYAFQSIINTLRLSSIPKPEPSTILDFEDWKPGT
jgi:hypothetical protein